MVESSDKTWSTGEGNGKPLQYPLYVLKESFGLSLWEVTEGNQDRNGDQVGGCSNNAGERWGWLEQSGSSRYGEKTTILEIFWKFSSVAQSCPTLCDPMNHSTPGFPVHHWLPESTQTYVKFLDGLLGNGEGSIGLRHREYREEWFACCWLLPGWDPSLKIHPPARETFLNCYSSLQTSSSYPCTYILFIYYRSPFVIWSSLYFLSSCFTWQLFQTTFEHLHSQCGVLDNTVSYFLTLLLKLASPLICLIDGNSISSLNSDIISSRRWFECPPMCTHGSLCTSSCKGQHLLLKWLPSWLRQEKNLPAMRETWVWSLDWEDPLEEGMATHSSIFF